LAGETIDTGAALEKLARLAELTTARGPQVVQV
jgi:hypothetical protein